MTSIASAVFKTLDWALANRKMALVLGNPGVGKSESVRAWAAMHRGRARLVQLKGINHRTAFFRELAKVLGVGCTFGLSASKMQARVEDFLEKTKIMVVVDEGQYLFSQQQRISTHPELVNWINTACFNNGVPVVIVATSDFEHRRRAVEQQTNWSSDQLWRIKRAVVLPPTPTQEDLKSVSQGQGARKSTTSSVMR